MLRVGKKPAPMEQMPPMPDDMNGDPNGEMSPMDDPNAQPQGDPMQDPNMMDGAPQDGQSQYDTNFDAGVEADEDEDPKKYIQQLTGKLSTTLGSYNTDNGGADTGLNKYVAKMIVKQAVKGMDDAFKKDIIKAINTADEPSEDDKKKGNEEAPETENPEMGGEEGQEPIQESVVTKAMLREMFKINNN